MDLHATFRDLVDRHYRGVWACVSVLTGRSDDTEDLVHQAFLLAFERLASGRAFEGDPGKWLRGTARNLVYGWWREKRQMPEHVAERLTSLVSENEDAFSHAARAEVRHALRECLDRLPDGERELVRRRYEQGERVVRIADELGLNAATVRTRLYRIRDALKKCLETVRNGGVRDAI